VARIFFDFRDAGEDLQRRFGWLQRELAPGEGPVADNPPMDVLETDAGVEIVLDLPGIDAQAVTVTCRDGVVIIAGHKRPTRCHHGQAAFHLAERSFGRFSRAVKLGGACDASRATATLVAGELRIVLPRVEERRGREIRIPVDTPKTDPIER
jgi:HSP20 family protein